VDEEALALWGAVAPKTNNKQTNTELNPMCHLLAFLGAHHIIYVSRIRVTWYNNF